MNHPATIRGRVRAVVYRSSGNPFMILGIENGEGRHTVKGGEALHDLEIGEEAVFSGRMTQDRRYGEQLEVSAVRRMVPSTAAGLVQWLMRVGLPGLDQETATGLVEMYATRAVDAVLDGQAGARRLLGARHDAAVSALLPHRAEERFGAVLEGYGLDAPTRRRMYEAFGTDVVDVVRDDPYRIVAEIEGFDMAAAERIARMTGTSRAPESRVRAAIVEALRHAAQDGHTALAFGDIAMSVLERDGIAARTTMATLETFDVPGVEAVEVADGPALALAHLARTERLIAERVLDKLDEEPGVDYGMAQDAVERTERELGIVLNVEQRQAAIQALVCPISIMTGGPGTGKTTTLRVIVAAWRLVMHLHPRLQRGRTITLGSPTGKAAKRMAEVTGIAAQTFHRMLEADPRAGGFRKGRRNPLPAGLLAFDEVSMADVPLFGAVVQAWGSASVLLVGDPDQLEPVGPGKVFADLIASGEVPTVHLVEVRRQEEGSAIAIGAAAVRDGRPPVTTAMGHSDLVFIEQNDAGTMAAQIARLTREIEGDIQVLCPGHKDLIGTLEMNRRLQGVAGNEGPSAQIGRGCVARKGDKVIQTDNDYDRDVFNGDTGVVSDVSPDGSTLWVTMGRETHEYSGEKLKQLDLAYALTVHKSQGSEYGTVIVPLHQAHFGLLKRTILYTAMTRARRLCIILGSRRAFARALANDEGSRRQTTLCSAIRAMSG